MSAYDIAADEVMTRFAEFALAVRETNRRAEKLAAAEVDFLNAVDEQRAVYEDAMAAFRRMEGLAATEVDV